MSSAASPLRKSDPAADPEILVQILQWMIESRAIDRREEILKRQNLGMFQLSTSGHEALAALAVLLRPEDLIFPHYRDRALMLARGIGAREILMEYMAKRDSSSQGRQLPSHHCSREHNVVSLSSPVGTQFLQAVGAALALQQTSPGRIVLAHIGDGSAAQGEVYEALNLAGQESAPVVFGIEDNHYAISTCTREKAFWRRPGMTATGPDGERFLGIPLVRIDGRDPREILRKAGPAIERARRGEGPTILVYDLDRMAPHSSADPHTKYRSEDDFRLMQQRDPVPRFGRALVEEGILTGAELARMEESARERIARTADEVVAAPDPEPGGVSDALFPPVDAEALRGLDRPPPGAVSKRDGGLDMAAAINRALEVSLESDPRVRLFGEDIEDPKGGVFGLTAGLSGKHPDRVKNSPLAEATIAGVGVGMAVAGLRPVFEIQFIDFFAPAWNQISNEMATFSWRSVGTWPCPLVLIAPCGGYLPGGALWHSQTAEPYFLHTPGLRVVMPSTAADAYGLLRYAVASGQPTVFLAPKHLFHQPVDECLPPEFDDYAIEFGRARIVREGEDVTVVAWGNAVHEALAAADRLAEEGIRPEIVDPRTLNPFDEETVEASIRKTSRLLVVHEDNMTCGFGAEIIARFTGVPERWECLDAYPRRLTRPDVPVPYHAALEFAVLPAAEEIVSAVRELMTY